MNFSETNKSASLVIALILLLHSYIESVGAQTTTTRVTTPSTTTTYRTATAGFSSTTTPPISPVSTVAPSAAPPAQWTLQYNGTIDTENRIIKTVYFDDSIVLLDLAGFILDFAYYPGKTKQGQGQGQSVYAYYLYLLVSTSGQTSLKAYGYDRNANNYAQIYTNPSTLYKIGSALYVDPVFGYLYVLGGDKFDRYDLVSSTSPQQEGVPVLSASRSLPPSPVLQVCITNCILQYDGLLYVVGANFPGLYEINVSQPSSLTYTIRFPTTSYRSIWNYTAPNNQQQPRAPIQFLALSTSDANLNLIQNDFLSVSVVNGTQFAAVAPGGLVINDTVLMMSSTNLTTAQFATIQNGKWNLIGTQTLDRIAELGTFYGPQSAVFFPPSDSGFDLYQIDSNSINLPLWFTAFSPYSLYGNPPNPLSLVAGDTTRVTLSSQLTDTSTNLFRAPLNLSAVVKARRVYSEDYLQVQFTGLQRPELNSVVQLQRVSTGLPITTTATIARTTTVQVSALTTTRLSTTTNPIVFATTTVGLSGTRTTTPAAVTSGITTTSIVSGGPSQTFVSVAAGGAFFNMSDVDQGLFRVQINTADPLIAQNTVWPIKLMFLVQNQRGSQLAVEIPVFPAPGTPGSGNGNGGGGGGSVEGGSNQTLGGDGNETLVDTYATSTYQQNFYNSEYGVPITNAVDAFTALQNVLGGFTNFIIILSCVVVFLCTVLCLILWFVRRRRRLNKDKAGEANGQKNSAYAAGSMANPSQYPTQQIMPGTQPQFPTMGYGQSAPPTMQFQPPPPPGQFQPPPPPGQFQPPPPPGQFAPPPPPGQFAPPAPPMGGMGLAPPMQTIPRTGSSPFISGMARPPPAPAPFTSPTIPFVRPAPPQMTRMPMLSGSQPMMGMPMSQAPQPFASNTMPFRPPPQMQPQFQMHQTLPAPVTPGSHTMGFGGPPTMPFSPVSPASQFGGGPGMATMPYGAPQQRQGSFATGPTQTLARSQIVAPVLAFPSELKWDDKDCNLTNRLKTGQNENEVYEAELSQERQTSLRISKCILKIVKGYDHLDEGEKLSGILQEVGIMYVFRDHPNFCRLYGYMESPVSLVMHFCARGSLDDNLASLNLTQQYQIARDVSEFLNAFHIAGFAHNALKSSNVLLDLDSYGQVKACVGDFGHSTFADPQLKKANGERRGKKATTYARYSAPELLAPNAEPNPMFVKAADMFSFGVILFELIAMEKAWNGATDAMSVMQQVMNGMRAELPQHRMMAIRQTPGLGVMFQVMSQCWAQDPAARPNSDEVKMALYNAR